MRFKRGGGGLYARIVNNERYFRRTMQTVYWGRKWKGNVEWLQVYNSKKEKKYEWKNEEEEGNILKTNE